MSITAMKQMVHELEYVLDCINKDKVPFDGDDFHEALRLGRQAIEQAEKQEPVKSDYRDWDYQDDLDKSTPQPSAQDNAFEELAKAVREFATEQRAIEAKLKEKNT
jgi:hypothetical protein